MAATATLGSRAAAKVDPRFPAFVAWLAQRDPALARIVQRIDHWFVPMAAPQDYGKDPVNWTQAARLRWNLNALRVLRHLEAMGQEPNELEDKALAAYSGWGGFQRVLDALPLGDGLLPDDLETAATQWQEASQAGRPPPGDVLVYTESLRSQYFTPASVAEVMWSYAQRLIQGGIERVLEPSAGVGIIVSGAPSSALVDAVELDSVPARIMARRFGGSAQVYRGSFEDFGVVSEGGYDVVVGNPPYMDRRPSFAQADKAFADVGRAEQYFILRALTLLRPGGVLVFLLPMSVLDGSSDAIHAWRRRVNEIADFRGGVVLPSSIFESVPGNFVVMAWTRRGEANPNVADTKWISKVPRENYLGTEIVDPRRGGVAYDGDFDPVLAESASFRDAPDWSLVADTIGLRRATDVGEEKGKKKLRTVKLQEDPRFALLDSLARRLTHYYRRLDRGMMEVAEAGRAELVSDLLGANLTEDEARAADLDPVVAAGLLRFFSSGVSDEPIAPTQETPQPGSTPEETVRHYSLILGGTIAEDLERHYPGENLHTFLLAAGTCLERRGDKIAYVSPDVFYSGDLPAKIKVVKAWLEQSVDEGGVADPSPERTTLKEQEDQLISLANPKSIIEIEYSPRSSFIPENIVTEWIRSLGYSEVEHVNERWVIRPVAEGDAKGDGKDKLGIDLLGYLNREQSVDIGAAKLKHVSTWGADVDTVKAREAEISDMFRQWIQNNEAHGETIAGIYNDRLVGHTGRVYSTAPVTIARKADSFVPRAHQNQTLRWQQERVGGCVFDSVGAGKTGIALLSAAIWKQMGRASRVMIVVPTNTLGQWYAAARSILPDYRVGIIGISPKAGKKTTSDAQEVRAAKWKAVAEGAWEIILVGREGFLNDVTPSPETVRRVVTDDKWLIRGLGRTQEQNAIIKRKLDELDESIKGHHTEIADLETRIEDTYSEYRRIDLRAKQAAIRTKIDTVRGEIEKLKKKLVTATDKEILDVIAEGEEAASGNTFRPKKSADLAVWEDLGIDGLIVDEAHYYKNLWFASPRMGQSKIEFMGQVKAGDDDNVTLLAWDLLFKARAVQAARGDDQGVMALTATPLKNSPLEVYNIVTYVSALFWQSLGINTKEEFIDRFLVLENVNTVNLSTLEPVVGLGVEGFKHGDEFQSAMAHIIHRRSKEDLVKGGIIKLPTVTRHPTQVPMLGGHAEIYEWIRQQAEAFYERTAARKEMGNKNAEIDGWTSEMDRRTMLILMSMLQKAACDGRLILFDYYESAQVPESMRKVKLVRGRAKGRKEREEDTEKVYERLWQKIPLHSMEDPGDPEKYRVVAQNIQKSSCGHLIFLDFVDAHTWVAAAIIKADPSKAGRIAYLTGDVDKSKRDIIALGFNGQDRIVDPLTGDEIQEALEPTYDILIGTSGAMAEGLNLQRRTCAIHHMSFSWEPATIEQREGRGVRQGNTLAEISIFYYFSEYSFDGVMWNKSQGKGEWQNALFAGNAPDVPNPGITGDADREEMLLQIVFRDPSKARGMFEAIRAKRQAARESRNRNESWGAQIRLLALVREVARAAPNKRADRAGAVRRWRTFMPHALLPFIPEGLLNELGEFREAYQNGAGSPIWFQPGWNRLTSESGEKPSLFEITGASILPPNVELRYRQFGSLEIQGTRLSQTRNIYTYGSATVEYNVAVNVDDDYDGILGRTKLFSFLSGYQYGIFRATHPGHALTRVARGALDRLSARLREGDTEAVEYLLHQGEHESIGKKRRDRLTIRHPVLFIDDNGALYALINMANDSTNLELLSALSFKGLTLLHGGNAEILRDATPPIYHVEDKTDWADWKNRKVAANWVPYKWEASTMTWIGNSIRYQTGQKMALSVARKFVPNVKAGTVFHDPQADLKAGARAGAKAQGLVIDDDEDEE